VGFNTTVIVMNDALHEIENDPLFGKKFAAAVRGMSVGRENALRYNMELNVSAGGHANAACVIESHHADHTAVVAIGGNYGSVLGEIYGYKHHEKEDQWRILEEVLQESTKARLHQLGHRTITTGRFSANDISIPSGTHEITFLRWLARSTIDGPPITDLQFEEYLNGMRNLRRDDEARSGE
jgi:hypothetical protein